MPQNFNAREELLMLLQCLVFSVCIYAQKPGTANDSSDVTTRTTQKTAVKLLYTISKNMKEKKKKNNDRNPNSGQHNLRINLYQRLKEFDSVKREGCILVSKTLRPTV